MFKAKCLPTDLPRNDIHAYIVIVVDDGGGGGGCSGADGGMCAHFTGSISFISCSFTFQYISGNSIMKNSAFNSGGSAVFRLADLAWYGLRGMCHATSRLENNVEMSEPEEFII